MMRSGPSYIVFNEIMSRAMKVKVNLETNLTMYGAQANVWMRDLRKANERCSVDMPDTMKKLWHEIIDQFSQMEGFLEELATVAENMNDQFTDKEVMRYKEIYVMNKNEYVVVETYIKQAIDRTLLLTSPRSGKGSNGIRAVTSSGATIGSSGNISSGMATDPVSSAASSPAKTGRSRATGSDYVLAENDAIEASHLLADDTIALAMETGETLRAQRNTFRSIQTRMGDMMDNFPSVNSLMQRIDFRKRWDAYVIGLVLSALTVFTLYYLLW